MIQGIRGRSENGHGRDTNTVVGVVVGPTMAPTTPPTGMGGGGIR